MTAVRRGKGLNHGGMGQPIEVTGDSKEAFVRLMGYLRPFRGAVLTSLILVVTSSLLTLAGPWLQGRAIDLYIRPGDVDGLRRIVFILVLVYLGAWITATLYGRLVARTAQLAMANIRRDLFARMQSLSMGFFDRNKTGDLMSRVTNDVDAVDQLLSQNLLTIINSVVQIITMITVMLLLDWRMTLAAVLPIPIVVFVVRRIGRLSRPAFGAFQKQVGAMNASAQEHLSGQRSVIALNQQDKAKSEFEEINLSARSAGIKAQTLTTMMLPIMFGVGSLSAVSVIGVGAWLAVSGGSNGVTVGLIATFVIYAGRISRPLTTIANTVTSIFSALAGAGRVFEILDEEPDLVDQHWAFELPPVQGWVDFEDVEFSYVPNQPILSDMTFTAEPGQMIGLVGPTGAGKSTIINLLNRFYDIDDGSIAVDDNDIADTTRDSLRLQLGVVPQHTFLFTETVLENIRFGRLDATNEEVVEAAKLANADHFITALPNGYQTVVSEGGGNLSTGQRQLLAIARAALADPKLLVLDEATSSVDTRTEREIQTALLRLMKDRTSFVIAHRLSTVRDADLILVIENGTISEQGTHEQLMELNGFYASLYSAQFRGRSRHVID